ncbi:CYTH and CHAD domain-containing protein [Fodinibacter luteus]|uniref:CYTH and CHAD domain-containing protein n=2 Tax=Fodinibacter luteus TaxID=552064 RepID=A0ABP8KQN0_9MICO
MAETPHEEVERKYTVGAGTAVPDLTGVDGVAKVGVAVEADLAATYFDTAELSLVQRGFTLRRREGGADEGWHLKEPSGPDARSETRLPLGRAVHTVPKRLRSAVGHLTGGRPLVPVARICTHRTEVALVGDDGTEIAVIADDDVHATRLLAPPLALHWREWEVELAGAPSDLLERIEAELLGAGARPGVVSSKLARALAEESPGHGPSPGGVALSRRSTVQDLLTAYLAEHLVVLKEHDAGLRGETVHRLRIAARRLRSALTTYRPMFVPGAVDALREELRWLGGALSEARDSEVLRGHLDALVTDEPPATAHTRLRERIDNDLDQAHRAARAAAVEAVSSERYRRLVRSLDAVTEAPPLRPRASKRARKALPRLLERDARRLRRAAKAARRTHGPTTREEALHEVRKKAKRLRYAAESATPVLGKRGKRLAQRAKKVQDALGAHQDTVASRAWLEELAARADRDPAVAFGAGRLHAREEQRAEAAERAYEKAWGQLPRKHVDRWVTDTST